MKKLLYTSAMLIVLGGCSAVEKARLYAASGAGYAVVAECALSNAERQNNFAAVNNWLAGEGQVYRVTALDCDGDGSPDF